MSAIARLLLGKGAGVSGSDLKENSAISGLRAGGAKVFIGHNPHNIKGAQIVVYSSAVKQDNPELLEAKKSGIPLLKRGQALAELMRDKTVITVTGSHGKTTTTSLVSYLLLEAGFSPTVAVGGIFKNIDTNAALGSGDFFVAEADESDGSFLYYEPKYSIVTNIDREHLDYYKTFENELGAFSEFIDKTKEGGCVFGCYDDMNLRKMLEGSKNKRVLFGLDSEADIRPLNVRLKGLSSQFDCVYKGASIGGFQLSLGGAHNISNALSVIALGLELGIDLDVIKKTLQGYSGTKRRLEVKFSGNGLLVIDDYAHHPTEIKATLSAIKNLGKKRIIAVFQPHRFSRAKLLSEEFADSFLSADYVIITDIYSAGEPAIEGIDSRFLYDKIKERFSAKEVVCLSREKLAGRILEIIKPGDLVITLGAGDIVKVSDELAQKLALCHCEAE